MHVVVVAPVVKEQGLGVTDVGVVVVHGHNHVVSAAVGLVLAKNQLVRHRNGVESSRMGRGDRCALLFGGLKRHGSRSQIRLYNSFVAVVWSSSLNVFAQSVVESKTA